MLAHGAVLLRSGIFTDAQVSAIARDYRHAGLEPAEVAMMAFAEQVTARANTVTREDIEGCAATDSPTPRSWTSR